MIMLQNSKIFCLMQAQQARWHLPQHICTRIRGHLCLWNNGIVFRDSPKFNFRSVLFNRFFKIIDIKLSSNTPAVSGATTSGINYTTFADYPLLKQLSAPFCPSLLNITQSIIVEKFTNFI